MERKLASVQKITDIRPIEGADKIEVANVLGWECVIAKKDNFKVGDLVIYIEIDAIVPERNEFEFLRERKFRVKTIKLRKQVSQGLIVPLSILPKGNYNDGADVTEILGVKKCDVQLVEEQKIMDAKKSKSKILRFFMNFAIFRWIYFKLNTVDKGWPQWIGKTDEERIQTCAKIFTDNITKPWYITEKLDGQSATYFLHKSKKWGIPNWIFGVCSRNIWLKTANNSNYWQVADKFDIKNKLMKLKKEIVVQGEILNANVQGNKYGVKEIDFRVFSVIENGRKCSVNEMIGFCKDFGLQTVPILCVNFDPNANGLISSTEVRDVVQALVKLSTAKSQLADTSREGIVVRLIENPNISFKVINPEFLLKHGE